MENKEYYIDLLESRIISYNEYWEDTIVNSKLVTDTKESIELLKTYFNLLKTLSTSVQKTLKTKNLELSYDNYPNIVKETIKNIIDIVNDGRDLWHPISMTNNPQKTYDHHVQKNGHLGFENNPWNDLDCYHFLEHLEEILDSEKSTIDFQKYINGKWYYFEGYENGSISVRFTKINKTKQGFYTFDGDIISWATIDSHYDGNGVIINTDCEDVSFKELPYCRENIEDEQELIEFIDSCETIETDEEIKESVHNVMDSYLEDLLDL